MPTIKQLEDQGRSLIEDQKALIMDGRPMTGRKAQEYEKREKDIKSVIEQREALKAVDSSPFHSLGSLNADGGQGFQRRLKGVHAGIVENGYRPIPAPQLDVSTGQAKELYEAAVSHKSLSVDRRRPTRQRSHRPRSPTSICRR